MQDTLLLNADYSPVRILDWRRAVCLLMEDKVHMVADYPGRTLRSPSVAVPWPAVVTLKRYVGYRGRLRFSRTNVLARDLYACQYCGTTPRCASGKPIRNELTLDHVVPRAQSSGGRVRLPWSGQVVPVTSWNNVVTACRGCNQRKADRTPAQAKMKLSTIPRRPTPWEGVSMLFARTAVPDEWRDYIPQIAA